VLVGISESGIVVSGGPGKLVLGVAARSTFRSRLAWLVLRRGRVGRAVVVGFLLHIDLLAFLVSLALLAIAVLRPSRELAAASQR
jgi:hypothetical protein